MPDVVEGCIPVEGVERVACIHEQDCLGALRKKTLS